MAAAIDRRLFWAVEMRIGSQAAGSAVPPYLPTVMPEVNLSAGRGVRRDTMRILPPTRLLALFIPLLLVSQALAGAAAPANGRFLYVAVPGIRNYLEYGGHGILVYNIDHGHKLVRRIPSGGLDEKGKPSNVKGICASAATARLYVSTIKSLQCYDLQTDKILWEKSYEGGCDRMSITPDGKTLFVPSFEGDHWNVIDADDGAIVAVIKPDSRSHNTIMGPNGREAFLSGLGSMLLTVADVSSQKAVRTVGPFSAAIRPFTIDGRQTKIYANVNDLLGFEIGDLKTGKVLKRVEVAKFEKGAVKRHGCPSHGIALTQDERELWLADGHNSRLHIFDLTGETPRQIESIAVRDQPGWITFSIDGTLVYPSTGEVIEAKTRKTIATLADENGAPVQSEKLLEVDFENGLVTRTGDQFAIGGAR